MPHQRSPDGHSDTGSTHREPEAVLRDELWHRQPLLAAINVALGAVVVFALWPVVSRLAIALWGALLLTSQALRVRDWLLSRHLSSEERDRRLPEWRLIFVSALTGLAWGALALLLRGSTDPELRLFIPFMLAGMAAGSITVLSACPPAYAAFLVAALGPYVLHLAFQPPGVSAWLAVITLMYGVGLGVVGWHLHRGQTRVAELYSRNGRLVAALAATRAALEARVKARTADLEEANAFLAEETRRRRHSERRARELSLVDPLTGLPNRTLIFDRLSVALARARRAGTRVAIVLIDVDRFKLVNDGLGHLVGDEVLRNVARRLGAAIRASDTLGRFGGDEFVAVLADLRELDDAIAATSHLHEAMASTVDVEALPVDISLSIGVAVFPDHGDCADELLGSADVALYQAKVRGRGRTEVIGPAQVEAFRARRAMALAWREKVLGGDVELTCARRFRGKDGRVVAVSMEAASGQAGTLSGLADAARSGGFLGDFERAVLRQAVRAASTGDERIAVVVGISRATLASSGFVEEVLALLEQSDVAYQRLELALDEEDWGGQIADGVDPAVERLSAEGVRFALDRFGSGRVALAVLRDAPVNTLRLAPQLVNAEDDASHAVTEAVLALAAARDLDVVITGANAWPPRVAAPSRTWYAEEPVNLTPDAAFSTQSMASSLRA